MVHTWSFTAHCLLQEPVAGKLLAWARTSWHTHGRHLPFSEQRCVGSFPGTVNVLYRTNFRFCLSQEGSLGYSSQCSWVHLGSVPRDYSGGARAIHGILVTKPELACKGQSLMLSCLPNSPQKPLLSPVPPWLRDAQGSEQVCRSMGEQGWSPQNMAGLPKQDWSPRTKFGSLVQVWAPQNHQDPSDGGMAQGRMYSGRKQAKGGWK